MNIVLYKCNAEQNKVDKSSDLIEVASLQGTMREEQDISNPAIIVELPLEDSQIVASGDDVVDEDGNNIITAPSSIPVFNYAFIPSFRRYYFVTSINAMTSAKATARLFRVALRVDVLMSFKAEFLPLSAMVERNEFEYDPAIKDIAHPYKDSIGREVFYLQNDSVFTIDSESYNIKSIAMTIYLKTYDNIVDLYYNPAGPDTLKDLLGRKITPPNDIDTMKGVFTATASPSVRTITYVLSMGEYWNFIKLVPENQKSFIKAVNAFPLDLEQVCELSDTPALPACGDDSLSSQLLFNFSKLNEYSKYIKLGSFDFPEYDYSYASPLSAWNIYVPFMGRRELDYSLYAGKHIDVYLMFSLTDNSASIYLIDTDGKRVETADFTLGHRVGVDSSNAQEVKNNQISIALNSVIGTLGNIISIGAGVATENPFMIAKGVAGEAQVISSAVTQSLNNLPQGRVSQQSSSLGMTSPMTAYIERIYKEDGLTTQEEKEEYAHIYGLPLNKPYILSDLSGFTKVADIHLENITATQPERETIYNMLRNGVIL